MKDPTANNVVWRSDRFAPTSTRQGSMLSVVVPADVLKAQHYTLDLSGIRGTSEPDPVSSYTFRVVMLH